jgi:glycosyltransferase involved in cell wall biosynthesis
LAASLGEGNFRFAAVEPPIAERVKLGWDMQDSEPWILRAGENEADRSEFEQWWDEADVVLSGERRVARFADRLRGGKLSFYMSERWWKPPFGMARLLHPRFARMACRFRQLAQSSSFHSLPMGGYAAADMRRLASFPGRMWDWGYFTAVPEPLPPGIERDGPLRILWAGRMLSWKRVATLVRAFAGLLRQAPQARLTLIGDGPCREQLKRLTEKLGITSNVDFHSSMPVLQVRQQMRQAHVYVLPSSAYEGWGVVLNEAMSEGCAVVASEGAGSAKTMLRHGENGLLFKSGDHQQLAGWLIQLNADEPLRRRLAGAGQRTISEAWSPSLAAERFLAVSDALLSKRQVPDYREGPMRRSGG